MYIRDPVVGFIDANELETKLIETPEVQRLRNIKQMGFAYLVYPGGTHTRFEHSLGTMQITNELMQELYKKQIEEISCVGLLHDIGHAAFSHTSDKILNKYLKTNHEEVGEKIIANGEIKDILQDSSFSYKNFINYFKGKDKGLIVTGTLGSDRLDYLKRDAYYTGVAYGVIDYARIKSKLTIYKDKPAIYEHGIPGAESMLIARYFMFSSVYYHHAVEIAKNMYEYALSAAIDNGDIAAEELRTLNDEQMMARMMKSKPASDTAKRLAARKLFKRAYYRDMNAKKVNIEQISEKIIKSGLKESEFTTNIISFKGANDDIIVIDKEGQPMGNLTKLSPLVETLGKILNDRIQLLVACDKKNVQKVQKIVEKELSA